MCGLWQFLVSLIPLPINIAASTSSSGQNCSQRGGISTVELDINLEPCEVSKGSVGIGHAVGVVAFLNRCTGFVGGIDNFRR